VTVRTVAASLVVKVVKVVRGSQLGVISVRLVCTV
jgi:hypothetical protein